MFCCFGVYHSEFGLHQPLFWHRCFLAFVSSSQARLRWLRSAADCALEPNLDLEGLRSRLHKKFDKQRLRYNKVEALTHKPSDGLHRVAKSNKVLNMSSLIGLSVTPSGSGSLAPSTPRSKRKISPSAETSSPKHISVLSHLIFQLSRWPSPPWPLTVGGLPITLVVEDVLTAEGRAFIFPRQIFGNGTISICSEAHYTNAATFSDVLLCRLGSDVNAYFLKHAPPGVRMLELIHTCERAFYVVLDDHVKIPAKWMPGKIANRFVGYIHNQELRRPSWADLPAKREIQPQPMTGVINDTTYDVLRPGVLIRSKMLQDHAHPAVFSTTSGVLVQNVVGDTFITSASHRIGEGEMVWHANRPDRIIGEAVVEISGTDVSLLKLKDDVVFINQTFETDAGAVPEFTRLKTSTEELPLGSLCYLNSLYTGNMEAVLLASIRYFKTSPYLAESQLAYNIYNWSYTGQEEGNEGKLRPPDGTCGSVIWNDEGVITGFYHYHIEDGPWAGFALSASASAVVDAGYSLAK
ncbi:hypothetical protein B0T26DRAFT_766477 [Lasiosphaeria miniovina]|uniref:Uncharacterized protein n=1 Tax=Lasiosphaeria miniovina TaxID=1954250 RepID=A0AA40E4H8_9PEZI|nr:uncharacterized protein B0T26DRAFT_766477 [Lasiosphaeria miniovina]KAK0727804.1 hypothetical protein B0T26DRAFT_766477 [Lasiosphaeria miniovina]